MTRSTRYILRHLVAVTVVISVTLTGVVWLTQSLRFVDLIINKGVSVGMFAYLALLLLPGLLMLILPVALFCAVLYTYHRLSTDSEILVLRSAGLSDLALARPAVILATLVMLLLYGLSLYAAPAGYRESMNLRFAIRTNYSLVLLQEGVFNTLVPGITVYVRERLSGGELLGILVQDDREADRPVTMMAERGLLRRSDEGPSLLLADGNRQQVSDERGQLSMLYFDEYVLDLQPFTEGQDMRWREPEERFLHELFRPGTTADDIFYATKLRTEGHRRLATPLYAMAFTLIALASILGGEFSRRRRWLRLLIAAGAAIAIEAVSLSLTPLVGNLPLLTPMLYAAPLLIIAAAAYPLVSWRVRRKPTVLAPGAG
jgi:lipopolysaccharide export system permease protein